MFSRILTENVRMLSLGARDHAILNGAMMPEISKALERDKWQCHVCGIRLPGLMEIDHLHGHKTCKSGDIKTICQFCHDLKHPVWAIARGRLHPVMAPELSQEDLTRICWTILSEKCRDGSELDLEELIDSIDGRHSAADDLIGGDNLESAIESILTLRDRRGAEFALKAAGHLDAYIRFIPACLFEPDLFKTWTPRGFRAIPKDMLRQAFGPAPDPDKLRSAAQELLSI